MKERELAEHLHLSEKYIEYTLTPFVGHYNFLHRDHHREKETRSEFYHKGEPRQVEQLTGRAELIDIFIFEDALTILEKPYTPDQLKDCTTEWLLERLREKGIVKYDERMIVDPPKPGQMIPKNQKPKLDYKEYVYLRDKTRDQTEYDLRVIVREHQQPQPTFYYRLDPDAFVYRVQYALIKMRDHFDAYADTNFFHCRNKECVGHKKFIAKVDFMQKMNQRLMQGPGRGGFGGPGGFGGGPSGMFGGGGLLPPPSSGMAGGASGVGGAGLDSNPNGVKRPNGGQLCELCGDLLLNGDVTAIDRKRDLLAQTNHLHALIKELTDLLRQLRDYEWSQKEMIMGGGPGGAGGGTTGVGARGGCSSAADLAARAEKLKDPLPWDDISLLDRAKLEDQKNNKLRLEEQRRKDDAMAEKERQRERDHKDRVEAERIARKKTELNRICFFQHLGDDNEDPNNNSQNNSNAPPGALPKASSLLNPGNKAGGSKGPAPVQKEDRFSYYVTVQGVKYKLEHVNEDLLDQMTEAEWDDYCQKMDSF